MSHKLVLVKQTEEIVEWECPVCERHIRVEKTGGGLRILKPGDQSVVHSATTMPGLNFGVSLDTVDSKAANPAETPATVH